jgi:hypothetical protein
VESNSKNKRSKSCIGAMIFDLESSPRVHHIVIIFGKDSGHPHTEAIPPGPRSGPVGSKVFYDPADREWVWPAGGDTVLVLTHELRHALANDRGEPEGLIPQPAGPGWFDPNKPHSIEEFQAVTYENLMRSYLNLPLRPNYDLVIRPPKLDLQFILDLEISTMTHVLP